MLSQKETTAIFITFKFFIILQGVMEKEAADTVNCSDWLQPLTSQPDNHLLQFHCSLLSAVHSIKSDQGNSDHTLHICFPYPRKLNSSCCYYKKTHILPISQDWFIQITTLTSVLKQTWKLDLLAWHNILTSTFLLDFFKIGKERERERERERDPFLGSYFILGY